MDGKTVARFWSKVDRAAESGCWPWLASIKNNGYGGFRWAGRTWRAHRVAWLIAHGDPGGMHVLHQCDNPRCVRPDHLRLGTHAENMADMKGKLRGATGERAGVNTHPERRATGERNGRRTMPERTARGERSGSAMLTEADVRAIRAAHVPGTSERATARVCASRYGIRPGTARGIIRRQTWRHVA